MLFLLCFVLALVIAAVRVYLDKQPRTKGRVVETFLLWLLVICVGVASVLTFVADAFFADRMAASLGWPAGNPFQSLVAVANLSVGVLGILLLLDTGELLGCYSDRVLYLVAGRWCSSHQGYCGLGELRAEQRRGHTLHGHSRADSPHGLADLLQTRR